MKPQPHLPKEVTMWTLFFLILCLIGLTGWLKVHDRMTSSTNTSRWPPTSDEYGKLIPVSYTHTLLYFISAGLMTVGLIGFICNLVL
jgi:hypothetical protein